MNMKNELPDGLRWSNYTLLNQIPVTKEYEANDDGIFYVEYKKKGDDIVKELTPICEAFSISMINTDRNNDEEVTEIQFVSYATGKAVLKYQQIPTRLLAENEGVKSLTKQGFNISNVPGYKKFLMLLKMSLNSLIRKGITNNNTKRYYGSRHYGFELIDGEYNFDNFIGIDSPIIPDNSFADLDKILFCEPKGTIEKEKAFLDWMSKDSKCEIVYKQVLACALMGITKIYLGKIVDNPVVEFIGPSSCGKGFFDHLIQKCWGRISDDKGISISSLSSTAGLAPLNDRLYVLPLVVADIQDKIKRDGVDSVGNWCYEHTNACNTIKAQADRQISQFNYSWKNVLIMMAEKEDLMQEKDGVSSRILHFKVNLKRGTTTTQGEKVSERDFVEIDKKQHENYGLIGPMFVTKIREYYKGHSIRSEFSEVVKDYEKALKTTSKNAALYALVQYTYNLAYGFGLLPERWGKMTVKDNLSNYEKAEAISSDEEVYNLIRDRVLTQTSSYIDAGIKLTQGQYQEREEENKAVRGRIKIDEIDGVNYKFAIIPKDIFNANVADLIKKHSLQTMRVNPKNWVENGWLLPDSRGRSDHDGTNITREYDKANDMKRTKERCYWLVLQNLDAIENADDLEEFAERTLNEVDKKNNKVVEFNNKWFGERTDGMMDIPAGIDNLIEK